MGRRERARSTTGGLHPSKKTSAGRADRDRAGAAAGRRFAPDTTGTGGDAAAGGPEDAAARGRTGTRTPFSARSAPRPRLPRSGVDGDGRARTARPHPRARRATGAEAWRYASRSRLHVRSRFRRGADRFRCLTSGRFAGSHFTYSRASEGRRRRPGLLALVAIIAVLVGAGLGYVVATRRRDAAAEATAKEAEHLVAAARREADGIPARGGARVEVADAGDAPGGRGGARGAPPRALAPGGADRSARAVDRRPGGVARAADRGLAQRDEALAGREARLHEAEDERTRELERLSGMTSTEARETLLRDVEKSTRHEAARLVRRIEDEAKNESEPPGADDHVDRPSAPRGEPHVDDDGELRRPSLRRPQGPDHRPRGPQHPRARDADRRRRHHRRHPGAVMLSAFDGVRREIARVTLEKLLEDGRIHPARIEEMYYQGEGRDGGSDHPGRRAGDVRGRTCPGSTRS